MENSNNNINTSINTNTKHKRKIVILLILTLTLIAIAYIAYTSFFMQKTFTNEYTKVPENNIFVYATKEQILSALSSQNTEFSGIIFLGFPSCKWCQEYAVILNNLAMEYGASEILYYDIKLDRANNTKFYTKLIDILNEYLEKDENGNARIYVPDAYFISNGKIIGHNNDTSTISNMEVSEYYTENNYYILNNKLKELISQMNIGTCNGETCED